MAVDDRDANSPGNQVCGYCGKPIQARERYRALVARNDSGGNRRRVVVACCREHLEALIADD
ncbi:MAG TPA: hypothetical protein VG247_18845 [Pseudonocardiaceae bacterium]|jgi:hypothetical protein|nr:hypothetical protein [Pseudonocardiaceae bacterium]